jgi:hypothetical protein
MKILLFLTFSLLCTASHADNKKPTDEVVLFESNESVYTLADMAKALDIEASDFETKYKHPSEAEYKDRELEANPIIIWQNPQAIKNPNPPANRHN